MPLITVGINHKTAPVAIREKVAFAPEKMFDALSSLITRDRADEAVIVSTCNRTELYCAVPEGASIKQIIQWLGEYHQIPAAELEQYCYAHQDDESVRHIMRVASGLDSLVLGEPQILGQVKSAYAVSQEGKYIGQSLQALFQRTFSIAKKVRTDTAIGENPVSIAFAAVSLAQRIFADVKRSAALLIGAGQTIELVARHLKESGVKRIIVANRTLERAQILASEMGAEAILLADIGEYLSQADLVISSTASQLPIIGKGMVEKAVSKRRHKPILLVDIAVPRDIEPEVEDINDVYLYTVDDLHSVIEQNVKSRQDAATAAEAIIDAGVVEFRRNLDSRKVSNVIVSYRKKAEDIKSFEYERALKNLSAGQEPEQVLQKMAHNLMNKLIHTPTQFLREAGADDDQASLEVALKVLGMTELKDDKN